MSAFQSQKEVSPEQFIHSFADFKYELGDEVQDPAVFIQRKRGDCDDFASLAAKVLGERGYHTKVVVVMMGEQTHVVCYVKEVSGYLDFNHRADPKPVIQSDGSLDDIADKVAADFRSQWRLASEVRYEGKKAVFLDNAFPLAPSVPVKKSKPANVATMVAESESIPAPDKATEKESSPAVSTPMVK